MPVLTIPKQRKTELEFPSGVHELGQAQHSNERPATLASVQTLLLQITAS